MVTARYGLMTVGLIPSVLRSKSLHCVDDRFGHLGGTFVARAFGVEVMIPRAAISLAREIYGRASYFPCASFIPKKDDTVIDLGANCGVFAVLAAKLGAKVRAVEAQRGFVEECREVLRSNGCNAEVMFGMVGGGGDLGDRSILEASDHFDGAYPSAISMKAVLNGLDRIDLLKSDIEGSEFALFCDADWLDRVEKITMETHRYHGDPAVIVRALEHAGFVVRTTTTGYLYACRTQPGRLQPGRHRMFR
jgi:hypothetical protein